MKNILFLEGRRSGYSYDTCGNTMTVGDLIELLQDFDEDSPIYLRNDNGYTFGNIDEYSLRIADEEEDDEDEDI